MQWCITVPEAWSADSKEAMKRCAEAAGLVRGRGSSRGSPYPLILVWEPEAALRYCQKKLTDVGVRDNEPYMVVDADGRTMEVIVREKRGDDDVELSKGSSATCGGYFVDDNFCEFMAAKYRFFYQWAAAHTTSVDELKREWRLQTKVFNGAASSDEALIRLPRSFESVGRAENAELDLMDYVILTGAEMASIFDPVVEQTLAVIRAQLSAVPTCTSLLLVGAFAESSYLYDRVKAAFKSRVPVIVRPPNPDSAVVQGAVTLAFDPRIGGTYSVFRDY